jgi:hypothetical protein
MTIDLINKRIKEQEDHLLDLWFRHMYSEIDFDRYILIYNSATTQLKYFEQKKEEYEKK